jgi:hypothetical protein
MDYDGRCSDDVDNSNDDERMKVSVGCMLPSTSSSSLYHISSHILPFICTQQRPSIIIIMTIVIPDSMEYKDT